MLRHSLCCNAAGDRTWTSSSGRLRLPAPPDPCLPNSDQVLQSRLPHSDQVLQNRLRSADQVPRSRPHLSAPVLQNRRLSPSGRVLQSLSHSDRMPAHRLPPENRFLRFGRAPQNRRRSVQSLMHRLPPENRFLHSGSALQNHRPEHLLQNRHDLFSLLVAVKKSAVLPAPAEAIWSRLSYQKKPS